MIGFAIFSIFMIAIGFLAIYRGKEAIRTKRMSNSAKSALVTGITELKGESAVRMGKVSVWLGYAFIGIGGVGTLISIVFGLGFMGSMLLGLGSAAVAESNNPNNPNAEVQQPIRSRNTRRARIKSNFSQSASALADSPFDTEGTPPKRDSTRKPKPAIKLPSTCTIGFPFLNYDRERAQNSTYVGFKLANTKFEEVSLDTGLLVGFAVQESSELNSEIQSIQAIYQHEDQYQVGKAYGSGKFNRILLAKPGFAVNALNVSSGVSLNSIQCEFARFDPSSGQVSGEEYTSEVLGREPRRAESIQTNRHGAVGIFGKLGNDEVAGIGLKLARTKLSNGTGESRTWTSSNRLHSFQATFEKKEGQNVILNGDNGKSTRVPIKKLSESDQRWLKRYAF